MGKRPFAVTAISYLLIAVGVLGFAFHLADHWKSKPFQSDLSWILLISLLAVISGVFMLIGQNWARWIALIWIGLHIGISFYHSMGQVFFHGVIFCAFAYFLFRPETRTYFGREKNI